MKLSLEWLREYVGLPLDLSPTALALKLTMATVEVERTIDLGEQFQRMVVGSIESLDPHPDAQRLQVVQCRIGDRLVVIVCGAGNLRPGMRVGVALPGATVRVRESDRSALVRPKNFGGVQSAGMICAAAEIGLDALFPPSDESHVIDLSEVPCEVGTDFAQAIGYDDTVLEIDNKSLTNRPDLWGHYGIARELAVLYGLPLKKLPAFRAPRDFNGVAVHIEDPSRCRRYTATRIEGVTVTEAPFWLRSRLARVDQRPINLLVDLTNYVLLALGQPSHAFDARLLRQNAIQVRQARAGEDLELLHEKRIHLDEQTLVIADSQGPVALAGVMGGKRSSIRDDTEEMILEIAHFEPSGIRRAASRFDARTESSTRFEKGLDPRLVDDALSLFMTLLQEALPSARPTGFVDSYPSPFDPVLVEVRFEYLHRKLGETLPKTVIYDILQRLGFGVEEIKGGVRLTVPSWRATGDVSIPEDIVEEVARIYGYERLKTSFPNIELTKAATSLELSLDRKLRDYLADQWGMQEIASYPWVDDRYLNAAGMDEGSTLMLTNPPSPNRRCINPSLIPPMLEAVALNLRHYDNFRLFELSRVFQGQGFTSQTEAAEVLPQQPKHLAACEVGGDPEFLFLKVKGMLEAMPREVHIEDFSFSENAGGANWADRNGCLDIKAAGRVIGYMGILSGRARRIAGIRRAHVGLFEIDVGELKPLPSRDNRFEALPAVPWVDFDLSAFFEIGVRWVDIERTVVAADDLVKSVTLFEEYRGSQVPDGKKSLTLRLLLGSPTTTLTSEEVQKVTGRIAGLLASELGADVRVS